MSTGLLIKRLILYTENMKKTLIEALGWYGTIAILGAYALLSFGAIGPNSLSYQLLNITGAAGIIVVSLSKKTYQPAVLNAAWILIALAAITRTHL